MVPATAGALARLDITLPSYARAEDTRRGGFFSSLARPGTGQ